MANLVNPTVEGSLNIGTQSNSTNGAIWYDTTDNVIKYNTPTGVCTL